MLIKINKLAKKIFIAFIILKHLVFEVEGYRRIQMNTIKIGENVVTIGDRLIERTKLAQQAAKKTKGGAYRVNARVLDDADSTLRNNNIRQTFGVVSTGVKTFASIKANNPGPYIFLGFLEATLEPFFVATRAHFKANTIIKRAKTSLSEMPKAEAKKFKSSIRAKVAHLYANGYKSGEFANPLNLINVFVRKQLGK